MENNNEVERCICNLPWGQHYIDCPKTPLMQKHANPKQPQREAEQTYSIEEAARELNMNTAISIDVDNLKLLEQVIQSSCLVNCVYDLEEIKDIKGGYIWKNGDLVRDADVNTLKLPTIKLSQIKDSKNKQPPY